jgi:hypothetical protein
MSLFLIRKSDEAATPANFAKDAECVIFGVSNGSCHHPFPISQERRSGRKQLSPQGNPSLDTPQISSTVAFETQFSHPGRYIAWQKFTIGDKPQYVSFVFDI